MNTVLLSIAFLAHCYCSVLTQTECSTPNGVTGTCIPLDQCSSVLKLVKNVKITQLDLEFLKKSHCGLAGTTPKVCCPKHCTTPASGNGTCVKIQSCPSLAKLLEPPLSQDNVKYIRDSICPSSQSGIVCCPLDKPKTDAGVRTSPVSAFPAAEGCGVESALSHDNRGGFQTSIYQYPWLVALEYYFEGKTEILATGSLISARYVLTAAQTLTGVTIKRAGPPLSVCLGEYSTSNSHKPDCVLTKDNIMKCTDGMIRIDVERTIPHPNYTVDWVQENVNDIALIRLKQNAPFTDFIRPICLPSADLTFSHTANYTLWVAIWREPNTNKHLGKVKHQEDLPLVDREPCQAAFHKALINVTLSNGHVCAGGVGGKGSCSADAGSPLMYKNGKTFEIIGTGSFTARPCGQEVPGAYANVYEYLPWIRQTIENDLKLYAN